MLRSHVYYAGMTSEPLLIGADEPLNLPTVDDFVQLGLTGWQPALRLYYAYEQERGDRWDVIDRLLFCRHLKELGLRRSRRRFGAEAVTAWLIGEPTPLSVRRLMSGGRDVTVEIVQRATARIDRIPGWIPASRIYGAYTSLCLQEPWADPPNPVTPQHFGQGLRRLGYQSTIQARDTVNTRCWYITRSASPGPFAELTPENLHRIVTDMGHGPRWYEMSRLYTWYVGMCEGDDLAPVSERRFSQALSEMGYRTEVRHTGTQTVRCFFISMRAFRDPEVVAAVRPDPVPSGH